MKCPLIKDEPMGAWGRHASPPIFSNLQESWSKLSHAPRELATVLCETFLFRKNGWSVGKNAPLPKDSVSAHQCRLLDTKRENKIAHQGICYLYHY